MRQQRILTYLWFAERHCTEPSSYTHEWQCTCEMRYRVIALHITVYFTAHSIIIKPTNSWLESTHTIYIVQVSAPFLTIIQECQ